VSFVSSLFYVCLAAASILFYLTPGRFRTVYLLFLSYAFYAAASWLYLLLLIVASAISFILGLGIATSQNEKAKLAFMALGVAAIVGVLAVFKAAGAWRGFLLPLGISYYSFKLISYLIEVYWDDESVERDPILFFLFPAFFPQIVSGPIQRPDTFFHQMRGVMRRKADGVQIEAGFAYIIGGLMLKIVVGDRLAAFIDVVDRAHSDYHYSIVLATVGCYTLQLYADFAGYTNIALGIGKLFGIEGPPNFSAPFAAINIQEMWRRWHMSLTSWLTDYLFTPLSLSLRNLGQLGISISICLNMVIIGLWHGFTLNYLIFGLLHALFMNVTVFILSGRGHRQRAGSTMGSSNALFKQVPDRALGLLGAVLTFSLMSFSQIFFHSPTWDQAISILNQILGLAASGPLRWSDIPADVAVPAYVCVAIALFVGAGYPGAKLIGRIDSIAPRWLQYGFGLFLLSLFSSESSGHFIYGQF
jgi:D-alanyl-lipoteichoic acid acyltransferase DltB (MBOAT superfamily)